MNENVRKTRGASFGTFKGVFLPSILTIFGVIMYLRLGWVTGNAGLIGTIIIVTLSCIITLITALSISSIATNMKVGVGGAYFMISRSMGVEAGAAIGLSLYFAKAIGIAFYIAGFTESMYSIFPQIPPIVIGVASLIILTALAYISADIALKASFVIFLIIMISLVSFFTGGTPQGGFITNPSATGNIAPFWMVFAVFFPAVTGIEAGIAMSGDLKNPARALPLGTMLAVALGFIVYITIPIFLISIVPKDVLVKNEFIFQEVARFRSIIILGIWGATLSSALGSLLGAPRTLQALARDRIVPGFLGKGYGAQDNPRIATAVSFLIALIGIIFGKLNSIAPVLSMFFLTTYGALNLIAGLEGVIGNPSWRPTFRTPWSISLVGALLCLIAMFMINAGATFMAIAAVAALYYFVAKMKFNDRWLDIRRSIHMALARFSIYRLADKGEDAKSWRPNLLVLSGSPTKRFYLIELADAFSHGKGFLTVASVLTQENMAPEKIDEMERSIREYLKEKDIPALVEIVVADNFSAGVENLVKTYGIGPLIPNTIVMGETEEDEKYIEFAKIVRLIYKSQRNLVIIRESKISKQMDASHRTISCWWGGKRNNGGLMLALAYMLQTSPEWQGAKLSIKTIVKDEEEQEPIRKDIGDFLKEARVIADADVVVHPYELSPIPTTIKEASMDADLTIIGMKPPDDDESDEDYAAYYKNLMKQTEGFPSLAILLAAENIKFQDIFV